MQRFCWIFLGIAACQLGLATRCTAQTWTNSTGDGLWTTKLNWSTGQLPSFGSSVFFDDTGLAAGGGTVNIGGDLQTISMLDFQQSANPGTYLIQNGTLKVQTIIDQTSLSSHSGLDVISANVTGTGEVFVNGYGNLVISGTISGLNMAFSGGGVTLANAEGYSGMTVADEAFAFSGASGPAITFSGASGSALFSALYQAWGGSLTLDNTAAANSNRLGDNTPVAARFGQFTLNGNATTAVAETVGTLNLAAGVSQVQVNSNGADARLTFQSFTRSLGTTLSPSLINNAATGTASITFNNPATLGAIGFGGSSGAINRSVLPYAVSYGAQGYTFATYDGVAGLQPLNTSTEYLALIPDAPSTANVRLTGAASVPSSTAVNSLVLTGGSVTLAPAATLAVTSGGIAMSGPGGQLNAISGGVGSVLDFGSQEAIFHTGAPGSAAADRYLVGAAINGSGGLTKSGPGTLVLTAPNTLSGGTYLAQGQLVIAAAGALPAGPITFTGPGTSMAFESVNQTISNPIVISNSEYANGQTLNGLATVSVQQGIAVTLTSSFGGSNGAFNKTGNGLLRLMGTISSSMTANDGTLVVNGTAGNYMIVSQGATLSGTGTIPFLWVMNDGSTLAPGDPTGTLTINSTGQISSNAIIRFDLHSTGQYSKLDLATPPISPLVMSPNADAPILIGGTLQLQLDYTPQVGDSFMIVKDDFTGPQPGQFTGLAEGANFVASGVDFAITYRGGDGNDVVVTVLAVPEPVMLGLAPLLLCAIRRRHPGGCNS